jgi:hypothetical protein
MIKRKGINSGHSNTITYKCNYYYAQVYGVKDKAVPLHATEALGGSGGIAPTHSRPRH